MKRFAMRASLAMCALPLAVLLAIYFWPMFLMLHITSKWDFDEIGIDIPEPIFWLLASLGAEVGYLFILIGVLS